MIDIREHGGPYGGVGKKSLMSNLYFELVESKTVDVPSTIRNVNMIQYIEGDSIVSVPFDTKLSPHRFDYNTNIWTPITTTYKYQDVNMGYKFGDYIFSAVEGYLTFFDRDMKVVKKVSMGSSFMPNYSYQVGISGDQKFAIIGNNNNGTYIIIDHLLNLTFKTRGGNIGYRLIPIDKDYYMVFNTNIRIYNLNTDTLVTTTLLASLILMPLGDKYRWFIWENISNYNYITYSDIRPSGVTKLATKGYERMDFNFDYNTLNKHYMVSEDMRMVFGIGSYVNNAWLMVFGNKLDYNSDTIANQINYLDQVVGPTRTDKNIYYTVSQQDYNYRHTINKIRLKEVGSK